jgi:hypothetical protein
MNSGWRSPVMKAATARSSEIYLADFFMTLQRWMQE